MRRIEPARIPSPRSMLSCDKRLPPGTWNRSGSQENVFANPRSTLESLQILYQGIHQFAIPSVAGEAPALISKGKPVAREDERKGSTIPMPTFARRPPTELLCSCGYSTEFHGWAAKTADIGTSIRQIPYSILIFVLEDKIQKPGDNLF